jgi:hypothetical protein
MKSLKQTVKLYKLVNEGVSFTVIIRYKGKLPQSLPVAQIDFCEKEPVVNSKSNQIFT